MKNKLLNKVFISLLTLILVFCLIPTGIFADDVQIVVNGRKQYYGKNTQNEVDENDDVWVEMSKIAEKVVGSDDEFDITITVRTKVKMQNLSTIQDSATAIVIDANLYYSELCPIATAEDDAECNCTIENYDGQCLEWRRPFDIRNELEKFLRSYGESGLDSNGDAIAERWVSITDFDEGTHPVHLTTDIPGTRPHEDYDADRCALGPLVEPEYFATGACDPVDNPYTYWLNLTAGGRSGLEDIIADIIGQNPYNEGKWYLNIQYGLLAAYNLYTNPEYNSNVKNVVDKNILLITGGEATTSGVNTSDISPILVSPTLNLSKACIEDTKDDPCASIDTMAEAFFHYKDYWENYWATNGIDHTESAKNMADRIKNDISPAIYTIGFGAQTTKAINALKYIGTDASRFFDADDNSTLQTAFGSISDAIGKNADSWMITAPMGDYVIFDTAHNTIPAEVAFSSNTLNIDLKTAGIWVADGTINGEAWYKYTYTYRIKIDTQAVDAAGAAYPVDTNKTSTLKYFVFEGNGAAGADLTKATTVNFIVPKVKNNNNNGSPPKTGVSETTLGFTMLLLLSTLGMVAVVTKRRKVAES